MTAFPVPEEADGTLHVYVSVGHQQMMTDAMAPLGLSIWQLTALRPMREVGGRLFVDVTDALSSPGARDALVEGFTRSDPLIGDALRTVVERGDLPASGDGPPPRVFGSEPATIETDPAIVTGLVERTRASLARLDAALAAATGPARLDVVLDDLAELRRLLADPTNLQAILAAVQAAWWLDDRLQEWLGDTGAADVLVRAAPPSVTAEMGLALLDVADAVRPHPEVVAFLRGVDADDTAFLDELPQVAGGSEARAAIEAFLAAHGMRGPGEIDITRPRWRERPGALLPTLLANVERFEPGERGQRIEAGRQEAVAKEREVLARLRALPGGEAKAAETARMIERLRTFAPYREHPKHGMVSRYFLYKQAILGEAERLAAAGVLAAPDDVFFLRFEELQELVRSGVADTALIRRRREEHEANRALTPPRVLTSHGETIAGAYRRDDLPPGALAGLAVSTGTVDGRARVVLDPADADLEPGDVLVTVHTDPSWSPVFVVAAGLVSEVGGLMTHGAVTARELGLPAVVGVERATQRIRDGQRIRVDGTAGYVVLLPDDEPDE